MNIQFLGAAQEVTGSKHLITTDDGKRILLDCGMYQGKGMETDADNRNLGFEPKDIDFIILSHAHIDHSGLIPYVYKHGFRGDIISTPATRDLCAIMLVDTAYIQQQDVKWYNKKMDRKHLPKIAPITPPTAVKAIYFAATSHLKDTESVPRAFMIPSSRSSFFITDLMVKLMVKKMMSTIKMLDMVRKNVTSTEISASLLHL